MAGMIPQPFIDDLLGRINIVELISSRVRLKKSGGSFKACCPFHEEKTPSFNVIPDKQFYHCFGCGASGNAIVFLREYENLSFNEAVEELARSAGMEVPRDEVVKKQYDASQLLIDALEFAADYYEQQLHQHSLKEHAQQYLKKRGLTSEVIKTYKLGFAPTDKSNLAPLCSAERLKALVDTKIVFNDSSRPPFDLFRNRIMFPIRNTRGKTIGFGGRTLGNDKAKYINSPESPVFHKSHEVYGIYEAYKTNRQLEKLLVCEGYMDVVALAQYGITYGVATLGTATNQDNLNALLRHVNHLVFCFDGDAAGLKAAHKAMHNCLPLVQDGVQIQFLLLPEGEDPDTMIRKEGKQNFEKRINQARPLSSFFFDVHSEGLDLEIPEHKGLLKNRAEPEIELIASATIKAAIKDQLYALTRRSYKNSKYSNNSKFQKKGSFQPGNSSQKSENTGFYKKIVTQVSVKRKPDVSVCLALYFYPDKAQSFYEHIEGHNLEDQFPITLNFSRFIVTQSLTSNKELLISLATDSDNQNYFYTLFDEIEFIPLAEDALQEANDTLHKAAQNRRRDALVEKSHTQPLNNEEKEELRALSTWGEPTTQ
ncbi:DNA primase [Alkalimarinus sediminis]|uniref:DNA primase n=1 Tax=Alkalimarinus sediminis TaxID=1632866 RepID=A0A9E8HM17_9ALTE|nr:DNA primase [Alkalimarinus sediminis]UZW75346.1 DNA primase [Alkalimarinus sediminis]